ncbi:MAG: TIGR03960 family B12-binding radical SAM protein, partial [Nitrospirae bacterium]|nr:TIGR03960 family B12-binding radical SAM protein [Nitrospirota bacterium]
MIDHILHRVSKPSRYIGGEIHAVRKDPAAVRTRFALIFPDAYEIGMSHLGLKILYHILNGREDVYAERAYAPWLDMEEVLRKEKLPLFSLETQTPLGAFDILGITLPYEMCYTNLLNILDLAGLPLESAGRDASHPLVLGGGTTVFNPEPVAEFFDAFVLGDGEEVIHEVVDCHQRWKEQGESREQLLKDLAGIEGVYIPAFHRVSYGENGEVSGIVPLPPSKGPVKRRIVEEMDRLPYPDAPPIPFMQTVHDRLTVEVARGCTYGCRFCQAGITYRPVRERSPERVREIVASGLAATGYEEVSLVSLSTGDYACLTPLLTSLGERYAPQRVSVSLPSLRIGTLSLGMIREVTRTRNKSFTIAP